MFTSCLPVAETPIESKLIVTAAILIALTAHWFLKVSKQDEKLFWRLRDPLYRRHSNLTPDGELKPYAKVVLLIAALIVLTIVWLS